MRCNRSRYHNFCDTPLVFSVFIFSMKHKANTKFSIILLFNIPNFEKENSKTFAIPPLEYSFYPWYKKANYYSFFDTSFHYTRFREAKHQNHSFSIHFLHDTDSNTSKFPWYILTKYNDLQKTQFRKGKYQKCAIAHLQYSFATWYGKPKMKKKSWYFFSETTTLRKKTSKLLLSNLCSIRFLLWTISQTSNFPCYFVSLYASLRKKNCMIQSFKNLIF